MKKHWENYHSCCLRNNLKLIKVTSKILDEIEIRLTKFPYTVPIFFVKYNDKPLRGAVDYRILIKPRTEIMYPCYYLTKCSTTLSNFRNTFENRISSDTYETWWQNSIFQYEVTDWVLSHASGLNQCSFFFQPTMNKILPWLYWYVLSCLDEWFISI